MNIPLRAPRALRHQSPERRERTGGQAAEQCATIWSHLPMPLPASGQLVTRRKTNRNQSKEQLSSSPSSSSLSSNRADHEDSNEIPGGRLCVYTLFLFHTHNCGGDWLNPIELGLPQQQLSLSMRNGCVGPCEALTDVWGPAQCTPVATPLASARRTCVIASDTNIT